MNLRTWITLAALALLAGPALASDAWIDSVTRPDSSPTQDPVVGRALAAPVAAGPSRVAASADLWTISVTSPDSTPAQALRAPSQDAAVTAPATHAVGDRWINSATSPDSSPTQGRLATKGEPIP